MLCLQVTGRTVGGEVGGEVGVSAAIMSSRSITPFKNTLFEVVHTGTHHITMTTIELNEASELSRSVNSVLFIYLSWSDSLVVLEKTLMQTYRKLTLVASFLHFFIKGNAKQARILKVIR